MPSYTRLPSISLLPRRAAVPLVLLAVAIIVLIRSSADFAGVLPTTATAFGPGPAQINKAALGHQHANGDDEGLSQKEIVNDPALFQQGAPPTRHQRQKQQAQWDWDWVKKATADKVKQGMEWAGEELGYQRDYSSSPSSASDAEADAALSYHRHLDKEHAPHSYSRHSPTLTFDHIYVLSLPRRMDRRARMGKIARALGFDFTFVDATSKEAPIIGWIAERVKEIRARKRKILASALEVPEDSIGGLATNSIWLQGNDQKKGIAFPDLTTLDERWTIDSAQAATLIENNDANVVSGHPGSDYGGQIPVDWVTYLESTNELDVLKPSIANLNVTELLHDPVEPLSARQVNEGVVATWYSQTRVWKKIIENKDSSALILEDDVDIEWDLERSWPNVERALPDTWDIVFLGHCWGRELAKPQYVHPSLHKSNEPRCLHGYALSQQGARKLLKLFSDPWRAYQTPVDTFMPYLTRLMPLDAVGNAKASNAKPDAETAIQAFSMEPPVVIQSKELSSDIQDGIGSTWRGLLADSTWDRILRDEGTEVKQLTWDDIKFDPAIKPRPWGNWKKPKNPVAPKHPDETAQTPSSPFEEDESKTEKELLDAERSRAREEAMARVLDPAQLEKERILEAMPKKPGPLLGSNKNKAAGGTGNEDVAAQQIQAAIEEAKNRGAGARRKGDGNRAGTGPKRLGNGPDAQRQ